MSHDSDDKPPPYVPPSGGKTVDPENIVPLVHSRLVGGGQPQVLKWYYRGEKVPLPSLGWLVQGIVPCQGVGALAGPSATGKSFVAMDLGGAVMLGTEFAGHEIMKTGGVLWFAAETPQHVPPRLDAWWQAKAKPAFDHNGEDERALPFAHVIKVPKLTSPAGIEDIRVTCQAFKDEIKAKFDADLALVVIDTFSASTIFKNSNDPGENQPVMSALEALSLELGAFVMLIDHMGKDKTKGMRGSSVKFASAYVVLSIDGDAGKVDGLTLEVSKNKDGITGERAAFSLQQVSLGVDENGTDVTQRVVNWDGAAAPTKLGRPKGKNEALVMDALIEALLEHGYETAPLPGMVRVKAVLNEKVQQRFIAAYPPTLSTGKTRKDTTERAYNTAFKNLKHQKRIGSHAFQNADGNERLLVWKIDSSKKQQQQQ